MAYITISSQIHRQQLLDLFYGDVKEFVVDEGERGGGFYLTLARDHLDVAELCELFEDIILGGNMALVGSPKLYETVREIAFVGRRTQTAQDLERYFRYNHTLCIEGYINFRLAWASYRVHYALHMLIKKSLRFTKYSSGIGETYDN
ncbi:MAG: hypothetical protein FWD96_03540 [Defluviitaleaceae bacterium]|nr:hypothetical protein [Defluviitaleaceae bacterium]